MMRAAIGILALVSLGALQQAPSFVQFEDITAAAGVDFRHTNGASPQHHLQEIMGSGGLFLDYDNDGLVDLFLVDGGSLASPAVAARSHHRLYRNRGGGRFEDVTAKSGIGRAPAYGMGACAADYDNDGAIDLFVTGAGSNALYHNNRNGTFTDVSSSSGIAGGPFATSCAWADVDRDGFVDLFVTNYVDARPETNVVCGVTASNARMYCHPLNFKPLASSLYHNNRNGTFTDISVIAGIAAHPGNGLGVVIGDYDDDGWPDIVVANDSMPNFLYHNEGRGVFKEVGLVSGIAVAADGNPRAGMGIDLADYDGDGRLDLFITNHELEAHTLFRNLGRGLFTDMTSQSGVGLETLPYVGFGAVFFDADNDGDLDLAIANGHVVDNSGHYRPGSKTEQRKLLFRNEGGRFTEVGRASGAGFAIEKIGRSLSAADIDNDGNLDLLFTNNGDAPNLLRNAAGRGNNALLVRLVGTRSNRSAVGARLVLSAGTAKQTREVKAGSSYLGQSDLRQHFGLGQSAQADRLEIRWPSGQTETLTNLAAGQIVTITEGRGVTARAGMAGGPARQVGRVRQVGENAAVFFPTRLTCLTWLTSLSLVSGCTRSAPRPPAQSDWFADVATQAGLVFTHFNGMSGHYYYPEIMAPGVALLDYDNDGDLDVYITQGQPLGNDPAMLDEAKKRGPLKDRLFRNDGNLHFTDVTEQAGINIQTYGMGVAVGDFNNDGFVDIYRTGLNGAVLLRNNGNGTFTDVTKESGAGDPNGWGVSAAFFDYDRDGWLDLFVGNYLIYSLAGDIQCQSVTGRRDYCPPNSYRAQPSRLFHNRGNGTFEDVTAKALTGGAYGPALGVSTADFNNDGWIDFYVANDSQPNQLWINQHNGTFKDTAFLAGAAVSGTGEAEASMGVDAGDIDNDGDEDLIVTNWLDQMNVLYVNDGMGNFEDRRGPSGLGAPSLAKTGFGAGWFDFDRDGWLDLFVANGGVATIEALARAHDPFPLKMTPQLYRNKGVGAFEDVSSRAGSVFTIADVGRGVAFGDIDNDGRPDLVVANDNGPLRLLMNRSPDQNHWVGLRLVSSTRSVIRDALGARVKIVRDGAPTLWRRARADGSYGSSNDPRVLAGLGPSTAAPRITVTWPSGRVESFANVPIDRYTTLVEGTGAK